MFFIAYPPKYLLYGEKNLSGFIYLQFKAFIKSGYFCLVKSKEVFLFEESIGIALMLF